MVMLNTGQTVKSEDSTYTHIIDYYLLYLTLILIKYPKYIFSKLFYRKLHAFMFLFENHYEISKLTCIISTI